MIFNYVNVNICLYYYLDIYSLYIMIYTGPAAEHMWPCTYVTLCSGERVHGNQENMRPLQMSSH